MITEADKKTIHKISEKYGIKSVLLFGSCVESDKTGNDIDIAVEGLAPRDFFSFYADLLFSLSKPVDIVDLSVKSKFTRQILQEGVLIYG